MRDLTHAEVRSRIRSSEYAGPTGVLLPIIAVSLLFVTNRSDLLGEFENGTVGNILGVIFVLFAAFLGVRAILLAFGIIG